LNSKSDSNRRLVEHLRSHAVRTDGPFTLRSGATSNWYIDARQTTFDGAGAIVVGEAVAEVLDPEITAVGGMTMGADPIAVATAVAAAAAGRPLRAFSVRKEVKSHGTGGRIVGPVGPGDLVAVLEDTTTTGSAMFEALQALSDADVGVVQVITLVDRSNGIAASKVAAAGIAYVALVTPGDLGVNE
jgi:orotate phosphoribosyltransferase